jgi:hypothetical protein
VVRARDHVREERVGQPDLGEVFGDFGTFVLDESNSARAIAGTECPDVGE